MSHWALHPHRTRWWQSTAWCIVCCSTSTSNSVSIGNPAVPPSAFVADAVSWGHTYCRRCIQDWKFIRALPALRWQHTTTCILNHFDANLEIKQLPKFGVLFVARHMSRRELPASLCSVCFRLVSGLVSPADPSWQQGKVSCNWTALAVSSVISKLGT